MDDGAPLRFTPRELEVLESIQSGRRSHHAIARWLDPPVSHRTAEAHVTAISLKLDPEYEPESLPFLRVILYALLEHPGISD